MEGKKRTGVPFWASIRTRLMAAFLVPVVCIILLGVSSYNRASSMISEAYCEQTSQTVEMMRQYLNLIIGSEQESFKSYMADQTLGFYFKGSLDKSASTTAKTTYMDELRTKVTLNENLSSIYMLSDNGLSLFTANTTPVEAAYTAYMASAQGQVIAADENNWHFFGQDPEADEAVGIDTSEYAVRWVRKMNRTPQMIILNFKAETIRSAMQLLDVGAQGYVALVSADGSEFYANEDTAPADPLIFGTDLYEQAVSSEAETGYRFATIGGTSYLFVYSKLDAEGAVMAVLIPEAEILQQTEGIKQMTLILTVLATILALLLATVISRKISGTINYILKKLHRVAEGDLTTHLETKGKDELALLSEGINDTVGNVKGLIENVNVVNEQLNTSVDHVSRSAGTFSETAEHIRKAVGEIELGASKLDEDSADCLTQMDVLSAKIGTVSSSSKEIERLTRRAGETVQEGMKSVEGLTESASSTSRITGEVIESIQSLEKQSGAINEIIAVINGIANRTNLLSLNASIEAARAGEAGRGFAVVAEEIRNLSAQCLESANQIAEIVKVIDIRTRDVVVTAKQAEQVVNEQNDAVTTTIDSFATIQEQVRELLAALETVSSNVQQMEEAREGTLNAVESMSAISAETAAGASSVNDATDMQTDAIGDLNGAAGELLERAQELTEILGAFRLEKE